MNAVLKYPGSKWNLADWIISHFPEHHSYVEPFFGSGAVLFRKHRSNIETVNDLNGDVVNLFQCLREDPERLARMVFLTPYSRQVYAEMWADPDPEDPYERALRFLVRCNQGHGFRCNGEFGGWKVDVQGRERAYAASQWARLPDRLAETAERLRGVQIECRPALDVIRRMNFSNVLIYADPPYVLSSRSAGRSQYRYEMTDADHVELLEALKAHRGPVLISGYRSDLYDSLLAGWHREDTASTDQLNRVRRECLWMNYEPSWQISLDEIGRRTE